MKSFTATSTALVLAGGGSFGAVQAGMLRAFGLVTATDHPAITDRGREALLEQNMRDAEDR